MARRGGKLDGVLVGNHCGNLVWSARKSNPPPLRSPFCSEHARALRVKERESQKLALEVVAHEEAPERASGRPGRRGGAGERLSLGALRSRSRKE